MVALEKMNRLYRFIDIIEYFRNLTQYDKACEVANDLADCGESATSDEEVAAFFRKNGAKVHKRNSTYYISEIVPVNSEEVEKHDTERTACPV